MRCAIDSRCRTDACSVQLSSSFVDGCTHGGGEIQTSDSRLHGHLELVVWSIGGQQPLTHGLRYARTFTSEQEIVVRLIVGVPIVSGGLGCQKPRASRTFLFKKRLPAVMFTAIHQMPVVQARSTSGLAGHVEAYWMDNVQAAARSGCGSTDIARVVGDLWVDQDDVK